MFGSLAADPASAVLYDCDLAEERKKDADSMLRCSEEHMSVQCQYEAEQDAWQKRAAERERIEALEVRAPFLFNFVVCTSRRYIDGFTLRTLTA